MYNIDNFITTCESLKITDFDYTIGLEFSISDIKTGIGKAIDWIIKKLKWLWSKIRRKKTVGVTDNEQKVIEKSDGLIKTLMNYMKAASVKGDEMRSLTEDEDRLLEQLNLTVGYALQEGDKNKSAGFNTEFYASRLSDISSEGNAVNQVPVQEIRRIMNNIMAVAEQCQDSDKNVIKSARLIVQFLQKIILRSEKDDVVKQILKTDKVDTSTKTLPSGTRIDISKSTTDISKYQMTYVLTITPSKNDAPALESTTTKLMAMDLNSNFNEYKNTRKALFKYIPSDIKEELTTLSIFPLYDQCVVTCRIASQPYKVKPGSFIYHISAEPNLTELKPSFISSGKGPNKMFFPQGRIYGSVGASMMNYYGGSQTDYGKNLYKFPADGLDVYRDPEFPLESTCFVQTDRPIKVEKVDPSHVGDSGQLLKRQYR